MGRQSIKTLHSYCGTRCEEFFSGSSEDVKTTQQVLQRMADPSTKPSKKQAVGDVVHHQTRVKKWKEIVDGNYQTNKCVVCKACIEHTHKNGTSRIQCLGKMKKWGEIEVKKSTAL